MLADGVPEADRVRLASATEVVMLAILSRASSSASTSRSNTSTSIETRSQTASISSRKLRPIAISITRSGRTSPSASLRQFIPTWRGRSKPYSEPILSRKVDTGQLPLIRTGLETFDQRGWLSPAPAFEPRYRRSATYR